MHNVEPEGLGLVPSSDESNPTPLYAELPAPAISAVHEAKLVKIGVCFEMEQDSRLAG